VNHDFYLNVDRNPKPPSYCACRQEETANGPHRTAEEIAAALVRRTSSVDAATTNSLAELASQLGTQARQCIDHAPTLSARVEMSRRHCQS